MHKKIRQFFSLLLVLTLLSTLVPLSAFAEKGSFPVPETDGKGVIRRGPVTQQVYPDVVLSSISNKAVGDTVVVSGSSSNPCYRMAAKYRISGETTDHWLGNVSSNSYYKTFTASKAGTYTVTLYARSYPENDMRTGQSSKSVSFTVYNKVTPTVTLPSISNKTVGSTVTVSGYSTLPCYRMSAKYVRTGETVNGNPVNHWLGDINGSSYNKSFVVSEPGTYTVTLYARSYAESDPRSASSSKSTSFTVTSPLELNVNLYTQETNSTCGSACARMILSYFSIFLDEKTIKDHAADYGDYTEVGNLTKTINDFLAQNQRTVRYHFVGMWEYKDTYYNLFKKNIQNRYPIQIPLNPEKSTSYLPYQTTGHYVVITGLRGNNALINDPCAYPGYNQKPQIPVSVIQQYNEAHSQWIICVDE